jgi:hypothetical protein
MDKMRYKSLSDMIIITIKFDKQGLFCIKKFPLKMSSFRSLLNIISTLWISVALMHLSCNSGEKYPDASVNSMLWQDSSADITDTVTASDELKSDTVIVVNSNSDSVQAFDQLMFGMHADEVKRLIKSKVKLGKYTYSLSFAYDQNKELYAINITSSEVKAIQYEGALQSMYLNLCKIISEKYGNKRSCRELPSIFDVMNAGTFYTNKWENGEKSIKLGVVQTQLNGYIIKCRISHSTMEKEENARLYKIKNKNIIDASEKF